MGETRAAQAECAGKALEEAMTSTLEYKGQRMPIPAKAKSGPRWSELE
jgi:hypothetical protein